MVSVHVKRFAFWGINAGVFALAILIAYYLGCKQGYHVGRHNASKLLDEAAFVTTFDVMQKLRAEDRSNALNVLEAFCYSSAVSLMQQPDGRTNVVDRVFFADLAKYRVTYAHPLADQYPTERELDRLLKTIPP